jgi:hypothetical protein
VQAGVRRSGGKGRERNRRWWIAEWRASDIDWYLEERLRSWRWRRCASCAGRCRLSSAEGRGETVVGGEVLK